MTTGDPNKNLIDPDALGMMDILEAKDADIDGMLDFIARYVRKVHTDKYIRSSMRTMPGHMFLEFIGPSNIAYLLAVFKNGQEVWNQEIQRREGGGEPAEKKLRPLFSTGDGKKREVGKSLWNNNFSPSHRNPHYYYYSLGKSLWNNEGRRYFDDMEGKWMNNYKSKAAMMKLYKRWDDWIETMGKEIRVGDGSKKTFHSVMGTWHDKNDDETGGGTNDDIGEYEENDGYSDPKSKYNFHRNAWKEGELVENDNRKDSVDDEDYNNGRNNGSDDSSDSSDARPVEKTAAAVSGGSAKTGKRGKKMTAGISDGSVKPSKRGKQRAAGIDGKRPSTRTRKRLFDLSKVQTGKTVET
jgi:hypothetical protein